MLFFHEYLSRTISPPTLIFELKRKLLASITSGKEEKVYLSLNSDKQYLTHLIQKGFVIFTAVFLISVIMIT